MSKSMAKIISWFKAPELTNGAKSAKLTTHVLVGFALFTAGCSGAQVSLENQFPTPLLEPIPIKAGIVLNEQLLSYNHNEEIQGSGKFNIHIGSAQRNMFSRLGDGLFSEYSVLGQLAGNETVDAILLPEIMQMQMALPRQTRSEYFEVWMRYRFHFYDNEANLIGSWDLPAYGKANQNDYRGDEAGLKAAALSACRDAMAFFSLNFQSESVAARWAAGEKGTPKAAQETSEDTTSEKTLESAENSAAEHEAADKIDALEEQKTTEQAQPVANETATESATESATENLTK